MHQTSANELRSKSGSSTHTKLVNVPALNLFLGSRCQGEIESEKERDTDEESVEAETLKLGHCCSVFDVGSLFGPVSEPVHLARSLDGKRFCFRAPLAPPRPICHPQIEGWFPGLENSCRLADTKVGKTLRVAAEPKRLA